MDHNHSKLAPSSGQDARVRRSRETLRAALLQLLTTRPFAEITIRDICARASIGYATYFRHYPGKKELLDDLAAAEIADLLAHAVPILYAEDSHAACLALCRAVERRRRLWSALLTGGAAAAL